MYVVILFSCDPYTLSATALSNSNHICICENQSPSWNIILYRELGDYDCHKALYYFLALIAPGGRVEIRILLGYFELNKISLYSFFSNLQ